MIKKSATEGICLGLDIGFDLNSDENWFSNISFS